MCSRALAFLLGILIAVGYAIDVKIRPEKSSVELEVGAQLSLLCKVEGLADTDKPGITWSRHSGLPIRDTVEVARLDSHTLALVINRTIARDSGVYSCMAVSDNETASKSIDVHVFGHGEPDSIFLEHGVQKNVKIPSLVEGKSVDLSCELKTGSNQFITTWSRNDIMLDKDSVRDNLNWGLLKGGAVLRIKNYNPSTDSGRYDCGVAPKDPLAEVTWRTFYLGPQKEDRSGFSLCRKVCQDTCNNVIVNHRRN
ncbi:unnamed protein product, partial [Mesorhabditis spiculigera]